MGHVVVCILDPRRPGSETSVPLSTEQARAAAQASVALEGTWAVPGPGSLLRATLTVCGGQRGGASPRPLGSSDNAERPLVPQPKSPESPGLVWTLSLLSDLVCCCCLL